MKKQEYMTPQMEVVNIKMTQNLLTTSGLGFGDTINSAAGAESRDCDDWDDDE